MRKISKEKDLQKALNLKYHLLWFPSDMDNNWGKEGNDYFMIMAVSRATRLYQFLKVTTW